ncbi:hypothetical protein ABZP36_008228 [Zizania latifolia]
MYPPVQAATAAASPYGVDSEHVDTMAAVVPRPLPTAVRSTGTKLHVSNLDASVTIEDVQVLFVLVLLLLASVLPVLKGKQEHFPLAKVFGAKDRKASSRRSMECSINSTVDFKDSPVESSVASSSASSSSFFKKFSENRSLKLSGFSTRTEAFRIFAATWNVAGQTPDMELNLNDLLPSDDHSDIYVLGFQEVVPLNAGNVLVMEDNVPAARWLALVDQALNRRSSSDGSTISEASASFSFTQSSAIGPSLLHKSRSPERSICEFNKHANHQ